MLGFSIQVLAQQPCISDMGTDLDLSLLEKAHLVQVAEAGTQQTCLEDHVLPRPKLQDASRTDYHVKAVREAGASNDEIRRPIEDAVALRHQS